jgi:hypothetical protein
MEWGATLLFYLLKKEVISVATRLFPLLVVERRSQLPDYMTLNGAVTHERERILKE